MINLKQIAKKYDVMPKDFDYVYYEALNQSKKISGKSLDTDLFTKFLYDKLEELYIEPRDIEKIVDHYVFVLEDYTTRKKNGVDNEELVEDESMQTSNNTSMDTKIGMNRKTGYKVVTDNIYA